MKTCPKCSKKKPRGGFYRNGAQPDGLSSYCRACTKTYNSRRLMNPETAEKRRAWMRKWQTRPEQRDRARKWRDENREKVRIRNRVYYKKAAANGWWKRYRKTPQFQLMQGAAMMVRAAIGLGLLEKKACEKCDSVQSHAHHDDYSRPFTVRWLCTKHHLSHHGELRAKGIILSRQPIRK